VTQLYVLSAGISGTSLNPIYGMSMDPLYGGIVSCSILHYLLLKMLLFKIHSISSRLTSQHISQSKSAVLLTSLVQERAFSFVGPAAGNQGPTSQKFSSQI